MFAAAPGIQVLEKYYDNEWILREDPGCEDKKDYCFSFIELIIDCIVLASEAAFRILSFKTFSFFRIIKSIPSTTNLEIGLSVSFLILSSNAYLSLGTWILVFTLFLSFGMHLSPAVFWGFDPITLSPLFFVLLVIYYFLITYILYYFVKSKLYILKVLKFTLDKVRGGSK